ncbi:hypothetical protein [Cellulophaga baltica]|uniref:hypothetical protein n=1 Tax=Cellulophaga baltica TaxID=76594 RepID=UPI0015F68E1D|nr:hypothetical protein [Cellulophaga baltica]MBA6316263.1 hypothetical protein [Cellulophaga baltica]
MGTIHSSVYNLNDHDFEKIIKGVYLLLEEDNLTFYLEEKDEHFKWIFNSTNSVINFDGSSLKDVVDFLDNKKLNYTEITSRLDVNLSFENFYYLRYNNIVRESESIDLFYNDLSYTYMNKCSCIVFDDDDLFRFKNFFITNNIKFRDFS